MGKRDSKVPAGLAKKSTFMDANTLEPIDAKESSSQSDDSIRKAKVSQIIRIPQAAQSVPRLDLVVEKTQTEPSTDMSQSN